MKAIKCYRILNSQAMQGYDFESLKVSEIPIRTIRPERSEEGVYLNRSANMGKNEVKFNNEESFTLTTKLCTYIVCEDLEAFKEEYKNQVDCWKLALEIEG